MQPVVILDANPLYGLATLIGANFKELLALARADDVRLMVPDVVVHELSRQAAKSFNDKGVELTNAVVAFNRISAAAGAIGAFFTSSPTLELAAPTADRASFYGALSRFLRDSNVEIPTCPDVPVANLLVRDLDRRKPFQEAGKGFRDVLIWETIRDFCRGLQGLDTQAVFVTKNRTDFCDETGRALHSHLRSEISPDQSFDIVENLPALLGHPAIKPHVERRRVVSARLTQSKVKQLVRRALTDLSGMDLVQAVGVYDGDGGYVSPIKTVLDDVAFNHVAPDNSKVSFDIFSAGDSGDMTLRATVEADCDVEGFIDKGDFLTRESDFSYAEDWNRHRMRVIESHCLRFTLSADFTTLTIQDIELRVDEVEDL